MIRAIGQPGKHIQDLREIPKYFCEAIVEVYLYDRKCPFRGVLVDPLPPFLTLLSADARHALINIDYVSHIILKEE
jgi:hypothetical protein